MNQRTARTSAMLGALMLGVGEWPALPGRGYSPSVGFIRRNATKRRKAKAAKAARRRNRK